ncbi:hypothetical protein Gotri_026112 [Gossypium trilobum]|uniref:Uncharacterized protein n=1 Tax=Gossypium trilobum TaxID=34281 RepID=A0A7J9FVI6_9ROSI|nr:hypothetical protein [Gossypium trilobum]
MEANEKFMRLTKSLLGDFMYTQYVELAQKQIKDWNQRRKRRTWSTILMRKMTTTRRHSNRNDLRREGQSSVAQPGMHIQLSHFDD